MNTIIWTISLLSISIASFMMGFQMFNEAKKGKTANGCLGFILLCVGAISLTALLLNPAYDFLPDLMDSSSVQWLRNLLLFTF